MNKEKRTNSNKNIKTKRQAATGPVRDSGRCLVSVDGRKGTRGLLKADLLKCQGEHGSKRGIAQLTAPMTAAPGA